MPNIQDLLLEKYKERRNILKLTNQQIAQQSDINISTVNSIFSGKVKNPSLITSLAMCKVLGISLDELGGLISPDMTEEEVERIKEDLRIKEIALKKSVDEQMDFMQKSESEKLHREEIIQLKDKTIISLENRNSDLNARIKSQVIVINIFRVWILALHIYGLLMDSMDTTTGLIRFPLLDIVRNNGWSVTAIVAVAIVLYIIIFWITKNIGKSKNN